MGLAARGGWGATALTLPEGTWVDLVTGRTVDGPDVPLIDLLHDLPVALLARPEVAR